MIENVRKRLGKVGLYPLLAGGAAVVIIVFGFVAFLGSQKTTPSTGSDAGQVGMSTATPTPSPTSSVSPSASAAVQTSASHAPTPTPVAVHVAAGSVLVDKSAPAGMPTWQSQAFTAPNTWTISYAYDCGGNGGRFTVAIFSDLVQASPVNKHGDKGSGTVTIQGGGKGYYIATDTTNQCSWHVTARA